jgi:hypothetical protein
METFLIALGTDRYVRHWACCTRPGIKPAAASFGPGPAGEFIAIFDGAALAMTDEVVE